ncbi:hypothetical protein [Candidatus Pelagisphaera phototrophica]|nr:hypothetical protein [Candidatus Pelagisphaera phototrophica]
MSWHISPILLIEYKAEDRSTLGTSQKNDGPEFWPELEWMDD